MSSLSRSAWKNFWLYNFVKFGLFSRTWLLLPAGDFDPEAEVEAAESLFLLFLSSSSSCGGTPHAESVLI